jgi:4-diphosphocytidyl-2-C-methyl-D-erythritol kinase
MHSKRIAVEAPAKINLFLEVFDERENGYHDIRTLIVPISLADELTMELTDGAIEVSLAVEGVSSDEVDFLCGSANNLASRAATALKEATGFEGGARIEITKRIPIGGGLGGGSTDAAAALRGLNDLWQTGLSIEKLAEIGRGLGSDIPAMVYGSAVLVEGIGDRVTRLNGSVSDQAREWWIVLVNPGFGVCTGDIYSRYTSFLTSSQGAFKSMVSALETGDSQLAAQNLFNSLEPVVFAKYPLLEMIAEKLREAGSCGVMVSGSGASLFGLARDEAHAREISQALGDAMGPQLWQRIAKVLPDGVTVAHGPLEARV